MTDETTSADAKEAAPTLQLQDLVNVLQIIGTCSQRGAFKAEELSVVGALHDRLYRFLESTGALKKPATVEDTAEATEPAVTN